MQSDKTTAARLAASLLLRQWIRAFAQAIEEQFAMPAPEALRHVNAALAANPATRGIRFDLALPADATEALVPPADVAAVMLGRLDA